MSTSPALTAADPSTSSEDADPGAHARFVGPTTVDLLNDGRSLELDRLRSWVITLAICAVAFGLRIVHLGRPNYLVFDETYYPKDAWTMLHLGYEASWPDQANKQIADGHVMGYAQAVPGFKPGAEFVVHPPLGKWLIALGEKAFGMNSFGWRFPALVFGTILVGATIRLARRLSRSTLVGALAGVLLTFDGLAFVMSRIGLLDIFQATFLTIAVACVVRDRDWFRHRLADHLVALGRTDLGGRFGPAVLWRPWRLAAGVAFGLACGVKWNSMFVLATMALLGLAWDRSARRLAGAGRRSWHAIWRDAIPAFGYQVVVAGVLYLASWTGWLLTKGGWDRQWGATATADSSTWITRHHDSLVHLLGAPLASLLRYHEEIYAFHTGSYMAHQTHTYNANPAGWLLMVRPVGIDAVNGIKPGQQGCQAVNDTCLRVISGAGTPILWWLAAIALLAGIVFWFAGRDWRFSAPIVALLSTWLPWFKYDDRPEFFFYAICIIPFSVTVLAMCLGKVAGPADGPRRRVRGWIVGVVVALVIANFAFMHPVLTDQLMTRRQWLARMWFPSWI